MVALHCASRPPLCNARGVYPREVGQSKLKFRSSDRVAGISEPSSVYPCRYTYAQFAQAACNRTYILCQADDTACHAALKI
jgi:hypothetical protein